MSEPKKCYVIVKATGQYSDRIDQPSFVYFDRDKAQAMMVLLEGIEGRWSNAIRNIQIKNDPPAYRLEEKRIRNECEAEYSKIGVDANWESYWFLNEAFFME